MAKGAAFEVKTQEFLAKLFDQLGFQVTEFRRQSAGTQNGFDVRIGFLDASGKERKWYFECKDYTSPLGWKEIAEKIHQLHASNHQPDAFIAISPHVDLSNITVDVIARYERTIRAPIRYWSPETGVREFFSLDLPLYKDLYDEEPGPQYHDSEKILAKLKGIINDLLRRKEELLKLPSTPFFPKELTLKIPRIDPANVIGREEELQELHQLLSGKNNQVILVNGMGGVGKTTLAQAYLCRYNNQYKHIAWITQLTRDIGGDITSAPGLVENLQVVSEDKQADQLLLDILRQMRSIPEGPNLLILDNAGEGLTKWKDYLPGGPQWHVLITSRQQVDGFHVKELDFLTPDHAVTLFRKHCSLIKEDVEIAALVKDVDYHTLTIEILAKTAQLQRASVTTLRKAIKEDRETHVYVEHKGEKIEKVLSYLSSIFNCSGMEEDPEWVMKQFVCLPSEFHPYELLRELIGIEEEERAIGFSEVCHQLAAEGWLLYDPQADAYKMHVIVQEVAKRQLGPKPEEVAALVHNILKRSHLDSDTGNPADRAKWIPFGQALLNALSLESLPELAVLQNNVAAALLDLGDYPTAKTLLEEAIASSQQSFGENRLWIILMYANLAAVLMNLGDYKAAKSMLENWVKLNEQNPAPDLRTTIVGYSNLGTVMKELGDYKAAERLWQKVRVLNERQYGLDHPSTALSYTNLSMALQELGKYGKAKEWSKKAISILERHLGPDHPSTAVSYSNQAMLLWRLGDYVGAKNFLEKALASNEYHFGSDHPTTAQSYEYLGGVLRDLGDYTRAKALSEKALATAERLLGPDHPVTALRSGGLATILWKLGDHVRAATLLTKALESDVRNLGMGHTTTAITSLNLALVLADLGDYDKALQLITYGLVVFNKAYPTGHPYIVAAQHHYEIVKKRSLEPPDRLI